MSRLENTRQTTWAPTSVGNVTGWNFESLKPAYQAIINEYPAALIALRKELLSVGFKMDQISDQVLKDPSNPIFQRPKWLPTLDGVESDGVTTRFYGKKKSASGGSVALTANPFEAAFDWAMAPVVDAVLDPIGSAASDAASGVFRKVREEASDNEEITQIKSIDQRIKFLMESSVDDVDVAVKQEIIQAISSKVPVLDTHFYDFRYQGNCSKNLRALIDSKCSVPSPTFKLIIIAAFLRRGLLESKFTKRTTYPQLLKACLQAEKNTAYQGKAKELSGIDLGKAQDSQVENTAADVTHVKQTVDAPAPAPFNYSSLGASSFFPVQKSYGGELLGVEMRGKETTADSARYMKK